MGAPGKAQSRGETGLFGEVTAQTEAICDAARFAPSSTAPSRPLCHRPVPAVALNGDQHHPAAKPQPLASFVRTVQTLP